MIDITIYRILLYEINPINKMDLSNKVETVFFEGFLVVDENLQMDIVCKCTFAF